MKTRRPESQMASALRAAGVRPNTCPIHRSIIKPCGRCDRAFTIAEHQRNSQLAAEAKARHVEWLGKGQP